MSTAIKPIALKTDRPNNDKPLPNSRRIYIDGEQPGVRVPFREISQNQTRNFDNSLADNAPVRVYDTSGPWGDPAIESDVREGLQPVRRDWILARGDVEEYQGRDLQPIDDGYLTFDAAKQARQREKASGESRLEDFPALRRTPLRAKAGACVTQMHYAEAVSHPELNSAIRENLGRSWSPTGTGRSRPTAGATAALAIPPPPTTRQTLGAAIPDTSRPNSPWRSRTRRPSFLQT